MVARVKRASPGAPWRIVLALPGTAADRALGAAAVCREGRVTPLRMGGRFVGAPAAVSGFAGRFGLVPPPEVRPVNAGVARW